jgi:hypothetical protein
MHLGEKKIKRGRRRIVDKNLSRSREEAVHFLDT